MITSGDIGFPLYCLQETVIDIEYFPAAEKPNPKGSLQLPDWVGGIAFHGEHVISACYDGSLHAAAVSDLLEGDTAKDVWVAPAHKKAIVALHGTQGEFKELLLTFLGV